MKERTETTITMSTGCQQNEYWLATNQVVACAANKGTVVCGRAVCRKGLCIN